MDHPRKKKKQLDVLSFQFYESSLAYIPLELHHCDTSTGYIYFHQYNPHVTIFNRITLSLIFSILLQFTLMNADSPKNITIVTLPLSALAIIIF